MLKSKSVFIHPTLANSYQFQSNHPFHPIRYQLTISLLESIGALLPDQIQQPAITDVEHLLSLAHSQEYINVIKGLSSDSPNNSLIDIAEQYGLHGDDTPYFQGMHDASCSIVSGTVSALEAVITGETDHAFHLAGGLHHAFENRAAGFCIYNDAVIAIRHIQQQHQVKILYIDTDVHHGDGVQISFYADPNVCTYSIHETGKFLFPGTGYHYEKGLDHGFGSCFNMPLDPYTEDDSWLECFQLTLTKVIEHYKPDLIVSQHGCDAHAYDPLSHLHCSMRIYEQIPNIIHQFAHQYCNGKWVAIGGGGYDLWRVVPRAWSHVWLAMSDHELVEQFKKPELLPLPDKWRNYWSSYATDELPLYWQDEPHMIIPMPRRTEISERNRQVAAIVIQDI
ncbi:acetoin utilization protein AcuC [Paenibacillus endoradicis]|uniref:acetoin utilization protein AcuC n=1 Tax=Paenibacillus endoradicis TaxID=2972487 RepID=UPI002158AD60|nr:acetoin utilization protein AcuC [Paenibacillus endoradicis]MCR8656081.1 acetoin utilization protein AcuC [Paenibacillus endoradicis]MCR8658407.1 acetoin utilization protein AcuC [Paenibacillus endoradicis]